MLDQFLQRLLSLLEVKFILAVLILAATVDILERVTSHRTRWNRNKNLDCISDTVDHQ